MPRVKISTAKSPTETTTKSPVEEKPKVPSRIPIRPRSKLGPVIERKEETPPKVVPIRTTTTRSTVKPTATISRPSKIVTTPGTGSRNVPLVLKEEKKVSRPFTREYQYYTPMEGIAKYRKKLGEYKEYNKWGQRKLAIMTIQFFTLHWNPQNHPNPKCLYIGAAPGYTILVMNKLFPQIEWHLYDLSAFPDEVVNSPNVTIHAKYFDDNEIDKWKDEKSLFLISDIRNPEYGVASQVKGRRWDAEAIIIKDMKMQEKWVFLINPVAASLKFRLPWIEGYYKNNVGLFPYLQGYVYLQSWLGQSSTEGRLVPTRDASGKYYSVLWDCKVYEDVMYNHNSQARILFNFKNPFGEGTVDGKELINDWDSSNEIQIWRDYLKKASLPDTQDNVMKLSRMVTNSINVDGSNRTLESIRYTSIDPVKIQSNIRIVEDITEVKGEVKKKEMKGKPSLPRRFKEEEKEEESEEESEPEEVEESSEENEENEESEESE